MKNIKIKAWTLIDGTGDLAVVTVFPYSLYEIYTTKKLAMKNKFRDDKIVPCLITFPNSRKAGKRNSTLKKLVL